MTNELNLQDIFEELHNNVQRDLVSALKAFGHSTEKGNASESVWIVFFNKYLPMRYKALKGQVIDSFGQQSDQIDVLIVDRFYTPLMFTLHDVTVVPAESVYAVFEVKPEFNASTIEYARQKTASVRKLKRTSRSIPNAVETSPAKTPFNIVGGILALNSGWNPTFGEPLKLALSKELNYKNYLDIGCSADSGIFVRSRSGNVDISKTERAVALFLLKFIHMLQELGTVPMIDMQAYIDSFTENRKENSLERFFETKN